MNEHPMLGRLSLLNSHRPIYPTTFGGDDFDDWSLWDWCQQCHRKNGLAVWVHAFRSESGLLGGEALAACILGQIDALEFDCTPRTQPLLPWVYKLWNAGFRVPLVGGSGKQSNRIPLGAMRTYAKLNEGDPRTYPSWVQAVREGRTFISNGPILNWDSTASQVIAESIVPFERLEIVANGRAIATTNAVLSDGIWRADVERGAQWPEAGWWAARCIGGAESPLYPEMPAFAHTSPMRIGTEGFDDPTAKIALRPCIEKTMEWIRAEGRFAEEKFRTQMLERCAKALAAIH